MLSNRLARTSGAFAGAAALCLGLPALATAHVTISPDTAEAGSYAVLTASVPHGCSGSGTTEVAIEIPEQIMAVTPTVNPNWEVEQLAADGSPADGEPVTHVVYTAHEPLPNDLRDTFELSVRMPDESGEVLAFPVVQTCEEGESAWVETADEGQDPHELEYPAPLVEVAESVSGGHGADHGAGADHSAGVHDGDVNGDASGSDSEMSAANVAGIGTGAAGIVLGGAALLYAHRRTRGGAPRESADA
ncbi:YcnI family protein [Phytoactinopolyspora mesophila]|nr:YcnI family protein [Phytoactinopolyspora mesophila]